MKILTGKVVSIKMKNAAVVEVVRFVAHPMYRKRMRSTKKFHALTNGDLKVGEVVKIQEIKPISKTVTWKVIYQTKKNAAA